jgi:peptidoglycan hydrolase-like protein with peptidoglycan-binding domain
MFPDMKTVRTRVVFILLMTGMFGLGLMSRALASDQDNIKKAQETLHSKGYDPGPIDGVMGSKTRQALSEYQKAEKLTVTGHLDAATAAKLGVEQETVSDNFKASGKEVVTGGQGAGHELKQGKPVAAVKDLGQGMGKGGKEAGEGLGKETVKAGTAVSTETKKVIPGAGPAAKKVGEGVKKAVNPSTDNNDPEKKQQ